MSYMNYEERLEVSKRLYELSNTEQKTALECIFPELKESEDEKIRKSLIILLQHFCKGYRVPGLEFPVSYKDMLAWLEKQGHEPRKVSIWKHWKDGICGNGEGKLIYLIKNGDAYSLSSSLGYECDYIELSELDNLMLKQGEQKPSTEVKPKFKVGDWVVYCGKTCKITGLHNGIFTITNQDGSYFFNQVESTMEPIFHLWTIQDAKNGDVLCCGNEISLYKHDIKNCTKQETTFGGFVYHCCYDGKRFITDSLYSLTEQDKMDIHPATKEQRNLLFQKMKEAGYTFDFEKKELKKVEKKSQRMISAEAKEAMYDKPTDEDMKEALRTEYEKGRADAIAEMQNRWSEEDKSKRNALIGLVEEIKRQPLKRLEDWDGYISWLKSLRPQNRWEPSDKQMRALEYIINNAHNTSYSCKIAKELLEQLRKLKGE